MTSGISHTALLCLISIWALVPTSLSSFDNPFLPIEAGVEISLVKDKKLANSSTHNTQTAEMEAFVGSFDLITSQNYPNGTTRADTMSFYFSQEKTAIIIRAKGNQPDMRMVFHPADASITALFVMKDKKGGYILPMNDKYWPGMKYANGQVKTKTVKQPTYTGEFRSIEGYSCEKVLAESSDYKAELWITEDIPLIMMQILSYQTVGAGKSQDELQQFGQFGVKELPLEVNLSSKEGKAAVQLNLINIQDSVEDAIFSTEGHTISKVQ